MRNPKAAWHAERRVSPHLHLEARHTCFQAGLGLKSLIPVCPIPYQYGYQLWWGAMLRGGQAAQLHLIVLVLKQLHPGSQQVIGMAAKRWMSTVTSAAGKGAEPNAKQPPPTQNPKIRRTAGLPSTSQDTEKTLRAAPAQTQTPGAARAWDRRDPRVAGGGSASVSCPCPCSCPSPIPVPVQFLSPSCPVHPVLLLSLLLPKTLSLPVSHPCPYPRLISAPVLLCPSPCLCPSLFLSCPSPSPCPAPLIAQAPAPRIPSPRRPFRPRVRRPLPPARPLPVPLLLQAVPELRQGQRGQLLLRHGASWQRRHGVGGGDRGRGGQGRLAELPTAIDRFLLFLCLLAPRGFSRSHSFCRPEVLPTQAGETRCARCCASPPHGSARFPAASPCPALRGCRGSAGQRFSALQDAALRGRCAPPGETARARSGQNHVLPDRAAGDGWASPAGCENSENDEDAREKI